MESADNHSTLENHSLLAQKKSEELVQSVAVIAGLFCLVSVRHGGLRLTEP